MNILEYPVNGPNKRELPPEWTRKWTKEGMRTRQEQRKKENRK